MGTKYLEIKDDVPVCTEECGNGYFRVPGAPYYSGICGIHSKNDIENVESIPKSFVQLRDYTQKDIFSCNGNYNQIGYTCFDKTLDEKSGFFFSRCYNQPNFYGEISNESKENYQMDTIMNFGLN